MRRFATLLVLACALLLLAAPARAAVQQERRVALVIGNGAYPTAPLKNPVNDARDMAAALRGLGFEVIERENASLRQMEDALDQFWSSLKKGGTGLFFFAGHGMQVRGVNYLVPVDARISVEQDVKSLCLDANRVLGRMENAGNGLNLVILDACRNNPFARSWRSADAGLAKMDAPTGTLIAYATAPDSVAADGAGKNGVYTSHLLRFMRAPGLKVEDVLKQVRIAVLNETGRKQTPWESSSLVGDFYFAGVGKGGQVPQQLALALPPKAAAVVEAPRPTAQTAAAQDDLASRLVGRYAEFMPEHGKNNGMFFEFSLRNGSLVATTSGWTGGVSPIGVSDIRIEGSTLRFRFTYKQGLFGMAGTTYTDYASDLSGGLETLPATYVTEKGNRGRVEFVRQGGAPASASSAVQPQLQAMASSPQQAPPASGVPRPGEIWTDTATGMGFAWVPGGCFQMGATDGRDDEKPVHEVCLDGFWMGRTEVTQGQWLKAMGENPAFFTRSKSGNALGMPVENVSWNDAKALAARMSGGGGAKFRLPTEAEWEYACRSGGKQERYSGAEDPDLVAWHSQAVLGIGGSSRQAATKVPNGLGLSDMSGNVWEWVEDLYDAGAYARASGRNPRNETGGPNRVNRGGSWFNGPDKIRCATRGSNPPNFKHYTLGLRLVRDVPATAQASPMPPSTAPDDLARRFAGRYAVASGPDKKPGPLILEFGVQNGQLVGTPSGGASSAQPVSITDIVLQGKALRFRYNYKLVVFGIASDRHTDFSGELGGDMAAIPFTFDTRDGNVRQGWLLRLPN